MLGDIFESSLGALFMENGFQRFDSFSLLIYRCMDLYGEWFEKDIERGLTSGDFDVSVVSVMNVLDGI